MYYPLVIIGGGPAGMTAAIYAARAGVQTLIIERELCGGKMNTTGEIANYPGFVNISGVDLSAKMLESVESLGVEIRYDEVTDTDLTGETKKIYTQTDEIEAGAVIIACGLKNRKLGCKGEAEFNGRGVSYCAVCDGFFFKNKNVTVVGSGNSALEEAEYLAEICESVTLAVRGTALRGEQHLIYSIENKKNIKILYETQIEEIRGEKTVSEIVFKNGEKLSTDAVFVAIGYEPDNAPFSEIEANDHGYFLTDDSCKTKIEGVFAIGDCREKNVRQIVTATADGACAAVEISKKIKIVTPTN